MKLIILGAPGAGKGTQAQLIADKYGIPHIATGDILRDAIQSGKMLGATARSFMERGKLVPDEIVIELTLRRLSQDDCKNGFILDGFPRTLRQAKEFTERHEIDMVIDIHVDESVLISRVTGRRSCPHCREVYHVKINPPRKEGICDRCGFDLILRDDDTEAILTNRLRVFHEETEPLIEYYSERNLIQEIDGDRDIQAIQASIDDTISHLVKK
ncbi:MAG: adenylate kinase [Thermoplasmata archaeon]|nr:MAG: adenylate kinase [Thermoplasmata archaeon]